MNKLQSMKMEECRSWPKWYYHLSLDGLEKNQLFNCDEQLARGMNSVALGQHIHQVKIVNFNLMVNHCHILGYGNGADFVDLFLFLKKRFNAKLVKDGFPPLTDNYFFKLDLIINDSLRKRYNVDNVWELNNDDRCRLAVSLRKKYKIEPKRIARKLHMDINVINKLFE